MTKCSADPLVKLRSRWFKRLSDTPRAWAPCRTQTAVWTHSGCGHFGGTFATLGCGQFHQQCHLQVQHSHPQPHDAATYFRYPFLCTYWDGATAGDPAHIGCLQSTQVYFDWPARWWHVMLPCQWPVVSLHNAQLWSPRQRLVLGPSGWAHGSHRSFLASLWSCPVAVCWRPTGMVGQGLMPPGWSSCFSSSAYPCLGTKQRLPVKWTGLDGVFLCQPGQFRFHQKNWPRSLTRSIAWPSSPRCLSQTCNRWLDVYCGSLRHGTICDHFWSPCIGRYIRFQLLWWVWTMWLSSCWCQNCHQVSLSPKIWHTHQSLCRGVKLIRVANTNVQSLEDTHKLYLKSRRVWVGIQDPSSPTRTLNSESHEALKA